MGHSFALRRVGSSCYVDSVREHRARNRPRLASAERPRAIGRARSSRARGKRAGRTRPNRVSIRCLSCFNVYRLHIWKMERDLAKSRTRAGRGKRQLWGAGSGPPSTREHGRAAGTEDSSQHTSTTQSKNFKVRCSFTVREQFMNSCSFVFVYCSFVKSRAEPRVREHPCSSGLANSRGQWRSSAQT
jgi:hypothetical protein